MSESQKNIDLLPKRMKQKIVLIIAIILVASANIYAQSGTIVKMKTTAKTVEFYLGWDGEGTISINGITVAESGWTGDIPVPEGMVELIATGNVKLLLLDCPNSQLTALDVTKCTALFFLECSNNLLTELDVTKCLELDMLNCSNNQLTELDVSKCTKLYKELNCSGNRLASLDISNCQVLTTLYAHDQIITLPQATTTGKNLTIENPITYNNSKVANITGATYSNGTITWSGLTGESGHALFEFTTELPARMFGGKAFSGTVTQPWINKNPQREYTITLLTDNTLFGSVSGGGVFEEGTEVTVTATPEMGFRFVNWTEPGIPVSTNANYTFTVNKDRMLVANFVSNQSSAVDDVEQEMVKIYISQKRVMIELPEATNVQIVNITGTIIYNKALCAGTHNIPLSTGMYVIKAGKTVKKVVI